MKIICNRSKLIERVNIVLKAVSSKSTMPILGCLILEVNNNIKLIWNIDLDKTAKYRNVPFISNINIEEDKKIRDRFKNRNANKQELEFVLIPDFIDENGMPDKDYYKLLNSLLTF